MRPSPPARRGIYDAMPALSLSGVRAAYGSTPVLDGVDLSVDRGELVALLGRSGCGKTTLLRIVAGLAPATSGTVTIGDRTVDGPGIDVPTRERRVGLVFQEYALFPDLTVQANVGFAPGADPAHVQRLLDLAGLAPLAQRYPRQLSGGQQQRVALARALAARPQVLLLDEPFANLDPALRAELGGELRRLVQEEGCAAVLVTHDRGDALALADRIAVLLPGPQGGRVAALGEPQALWAEPPGPEVAAIVSEGDPVDGAALGLPPGPVWARPDQLRFTQGSGPATVVGRRFVGPHTVLDVALGDLRLGAHHDRMLPVGTQGDLAFVGEPWRFHDGGS